jgi:hypothetical protein
MICSSSLFLAVLLAMALAAADRCIVHVRDLGFITGPMNELHCSLGDVCANKPNQSIAISQYLFLKKTKPKRRFIFMFMSM